MFAASPPVGYSCWHLKSVVNGNTVYHVKGALFNHVLQVGVSPDEQEYAPTCSMLLLGGPLQKWVLWACLWLQLSYLKDLVLHISSERFIDTPAFIRRSFFLTPLCTKLPGLTVLYVIFQWRWWFFLLFWFPLHWITTSMNVTLFQSIACKKENKLFSF